MRALYGNDHPDLERIIKYVDEEYITKAKGMGRIGFVK
jgi:hypothetical protein